MITWWILSIPEKSLVSFDYNVWLLSITFDIHQDVSCNLTFANLFSRYADTTVYVFRIVLTVNSINRLVSVAET
jgi:hypothetical protein